MREIRKLEKKILLRHSPPAAGKLAIDFKKPFNLLANLPAEARGEAPSEATNSIWWTILKLARTIFAAFGGKKCSDYFQDSAHKIFASLKF